MLCVMYVRLHVVGSWVHWTYRASDITMFLINLLFVLHKLFHDNINSSAQLYWFNVYLDFNERLQRHLSIGLYYMIGNGHTTEMLPFWQMCARMSFYLIYCQFLLTYARTVITGKTSTECCSVIIKTVIFKTVIVSQGTDKMSAASVSSWKQCKFW